MATHTLSKKLFVGVLAISGACALAACSPVEAVPSTYNNNILVDSEGKAIPTNDNIMGALFEAISSGKDSKVLNVIMEELVNEKYGVKATNGSGESLGYSVYTEIKSLETENDETKIKAYCNNHPDVFVREGDEEGMQVQRFKDFVKDIDKRIAKEFLSLVKDSKYEDDNGMFDEQLLVDALKEEHWDIKEFENGDTANKFFITAGITEDNIFSNLHMYLYSYEETAEMERKIGDDTCFKEQAKGYIEKKIFPKVLKDKLVEEFILNTEARALGNASARKINYVKVSYTSDNRSYVKSILSDFDKEFIYKAETVDATRSNEQINYDIINYAMIGFDHLNQGHFVNNEPLIDVDQTNGDQINDTYDTKNVSARTYNEHYYNDILSAEDKEYEEVHKIVDVKVLTNNEVKDVFKTVDGSIIFNKDFKVYGDTELGKLLNDYNKAIKAKDNFYTATDDEKTALNRFTPSSSPSMGDALKEEILTLAKKDITTDGWFVKNGGASELPSSLRDRLFRLSVATNLESEETGYTEEKFVDGIENTLGAYRYDTNGDVRGTIPYVRNINGRKFIMPSDATDFVENTTTDATELLFQNDNFVKAENNSFYICQVLEAVSYAKIDPKAKTCYKVNGEVDYMRIEQTQREIAKVLSTKDTYATNAFTEYLNSYKFRFGDTSMYEYLKGQYPDLDIFDED